ncbi:hypothetical protein SFRURICE_017098 [Spodoptera frugiperda]|nr:hypothetical protein SFRURICE_017098 [Spodoptera frugiperda]
MFSKILLKFLYFSSSSPVHYPLDEDIQRMFYPFNCLLLLLCTPKYAIRNSYIVPNGITRTILSFLSVCFVIIVSVFYLFFQEQNDVYASAHEGAIELVITIFLHILYISITIMIFVLNIIHSKDNILLMVSIQKIYRSFIIIKGVNSFVIWNWIIAGVTIISNIAIYTSFHMTSNGVYIFTLPLLIRNCMYATVDVNCVYAIRVLALLNKCLDEWVDRIARLNEEEEYYMNTTKLVNVYLDILKAYKLYKTLFQAWLVVFYKYPVFGFMASLWIFKDIALIVIQSVQCEKFYLANERAKTACILLLRDKNCPNDQRRLYKQILQTNRVFSKMSAYGLFYVDPRLTIAVVELFTGYY